jgi:hypothetical protein
MPTATPSHPTPAASAGCATPGPWRVVSNASGRAFIVAEPDGPQVVVAECHGLVNLERDANLNLIAAAPELRDVAHAALTYLLADEQAEFAGREWLIDLARAALAKSEGK